jgi:lipoprotein-releasing system permease protein
MKKLLFERLIASKMFTQQSTGGGMSKPIVRVAVGGIVVGLAVMILTLAVMNGFQKSIRQKVIGFGSHIQIMGFDNNASFEADSVNRNQPTIEQVKKIPGVKHVQVFGIKPGIIKTGDQLLGVVLKGVDKDFDWSFFKQNLKEGKIFDLPDTVSNQVLVSKYIADKMGLEVGKKFRMYFLRGNETKPRAFVVSGIYETGLTEGFDDKFLICDIRQVQKLNNWEPQFVAGFEVLVDKYESIDTVTTQINNTIDINMNAQSIKELTPQIFSWLDVLDVNALIIIVLMLFVSMINMISALIILILDRTNMIGTLKALGAGNQSVIRIFILHASNLVLLGMLLGNVLGIGLCFLQDHFGFVHLDEASYYVKTVPIAIDWMNILYLNLATFGMCFIALLIPVYIVTQVSPVKAIRFS